MAEFDCKYNYLLCTVYYQLRYLKIIINIGYHNIRYYQISQYPSGAAHGYDVLV